MIKSLGFQENSLWNIFKIKKIVLLLKFKKISKKTNKKIHNNFN